MRALIRTFIGNRDGAAAAEMALVTPLLLTLMFGAFELGKYFLDAHAVAKAVRDGARFAARLDFAQYAGCAPSSSVIADTRNLTRTGQVASGGTARLSYWTDPTTITVSVTCATGYEGIYRGSSIDAPVVTVSASVPYAPLLAPVGFDSTGLSVNATSRATVSGI